MVVERGEAFGGVGDGQASGLAGGRRGDGDVEAVVAKVESGDLGGVVEDLVVPRPACAEGLVVEHVVVADDVAGNAGEAVGAETFGPVAQDGELVHRHVFVGLAAERGVAAAAQDHVSDERAVCSDGCGGVEAGGEAGVGAERVDHGRAGVQLRVARRHKPAVGVAAVERLARDGVHHKHAPEAVGEAGLVECRVDAVGEALGRGGRRDEGRENKQRGQEPDKTCKHRAKLSKAR